MQPCSYSSVHCMYRVAKVTYIALCTRCGHNLIIFWPCHFWGSVHFSYSHLKHTVFGSKIRVKGKKMGFPKIKMEKMELPKIKMESGKKLDFIGPYMWYQWAHDASTTIFHVLPHTCTYFTKRTHTHTHTQCI